MVKILAIGNSFHLHYIYGRYAAALTWLRVFFGVSVRGNAYLPQKPFCDEPLDEAKLRLVRNCVEEFFSEN